MTLILERDLDILKLYLHTKMFPGQDFQQLEHEESKTTVDRHIHTQTDRRDRCHYHAAFGLVTIPDAFLSGKLCFSLFRDKHVCIFVRFKHKCFKIAPT